MGQGKFSESIAVFEKALTELKPRDARGQSRINLRIADAYDQLGMASLAAAHREKAKIEE